MCFHIVEIEVAFSFIDAVALEDAYTFAELVNGDVVGAANGVDPWCLLQQELESLFVGHGKEFGFGGGGEWGRWQGIGAVGPIGIRMDEMCRGNIFGDRGCLRVGGRWRGYALCGFASFRPCVVGEHVGEYI